MRASATWLAVAFQGMGAVSSVLPATSTVSVKLPEVAVVVSWVWPLAVYEPKELPCRGWDSVLSVTVRSWLPAPAMFQGLDWVPAPETVTFRPVSYTHLTLPTILLV